jgi:TIR domain
MKAFISYSHHDSVMLDHLHMHLAQLRRDSLINEWTDREIEAGGRVDDRVARALKDADLFIPLLSPHYIASTYCYDKEFVTALEREKAGSIVIVPVIVQPCDWLNTPFKIFKALPTDGKAASDWSNVNTAFFSVTQGLRQMLAGNSAPTGKTESIASPSRVASRNYKVKTDFDSIQKMGFVDKTFAEVKDYIRQALEEVTQLDNIKAKAGANTNNKFEYLLVNRNQINSEAQLTVTTDQGTAGFPSLRSGSLQLSYSIGEMSRPGQLKSFAVAWDDFHLFWSDGPISAFYGRPRTGELSSKEIGEIIFNEWLKAVGILE